MSYHVCLSAVLFCIAVSVSAQEELILGSIQEYREASNRLSTYDDLKVDWTMDGQTQVYFNEGLNNLIENHPAMAETNFNEVLKREPKLWQAFYFRGVSRRQLEKFGGARWDFQQALNLHRCYEAQVEMGKIEQQTFNVAEAVKAYDKAVKMAPEKPVAYYLKANILADLGQGKNAVEGYTQCLVRDSLFHDARIRLGLMKVTSPATTAQALPEVNQVLKMDSLHRYGLFFRSIFAFKSEPVQTEKDLNRLVRLWPTNLMVLYLRGLMLSSQGNYERAFPDFHKLIEATYHDENAFRGQQSWIDKRIDIQNAGAYTVMRVYGLSEFDSRLIKEAYCQLITGHYSQAIYTIDKTNISYKDPLCFFLKGVASEHMRNHNQAYRYYAKTLALDNDILDAHKKRGIYEQELEEWDKSIADFNEMLRINREAFVAYKLRGLSYYHSKQVPKAIADFTRYLQRDSLDKEAYGFRGMAHLATRQPLEAAVDFANSGNVHMLNFKKLTYSLDSMLILKDTAKAYAYANRLTKAAPFFTEGYALKLKLLASHGDWPRVGQEVSRALANSRTDAPKQSHSLLLAIQAAAWAKEKEYDRAFTTFDEALKFDQANTWALLERGKVFLEMSKKSKAISDFKKASGYGNKEAQALLKHLEE
ncbi:tetratricopeptide repeat protein [Chryseolinea lacunae]|uniref:Tetratricopeptide repeat protein n=1 Tax=Chryseolinea lacunae TaxID=2801331 RepID=A0ABS1KN56_9BACT|nr:tetratricopeptide repeat protein [Chryseolinea lacunae]MBL0740779.1 tetratricopeptide repeat protein [Chryseolinea lacunae]